MKKSELSANLEDVICIAYVIDNGDSYIKAVGTLGGDLDAPLSITIEGNVPNEELRVLTLDQDLVKPKTSLIHLNRYIRRFGKIMRSVQLEGCA